MPGLKAIADASFRLESLLRTMSNGLPGLTRAPLMYSVPRSMPRTEEEAVADVMREENAKTRVVRRREKEREDFAWDRTIVRKLRGE